MGSGRVWGRRFPPGCQSPGLGYPCHERVFQPHSPLLEDQRSFWTPSSSFRPFFSQQVDSRGPPACQLLNTPTWIWYFKKGSWGKFPSGPVVGTPCFHCHGCNSILGQGNKILTSFVVGPKEKKKKGSWALSNHRPWFPSPLGLKGQTRSLPMGLCWPQRVSGELTLDFCLGFLGVGGDEDVVKVPEAPLQDFWGQSSLAYSPKCRIWCL